MSFFEDVPAPSESDEQPHEPWVPPPWFAPPPTTLPGLVPLRRVLAETTTIAIVLDLVEATPDGVRIRFAVHAHRPLGMTEEAWWELNNQVVGHGPRPPRAGAADPGLLVGVQLPDGTKVVTLDTPPLPGPDTEEPSRPLLRMDWGSGSGSDDHAVTERRVWLWPLPPPGELTLAVAWTAVGIEETTTRLDGVAIRAAAADAHELFTA